MEGMEGKIQRIQIEIRRMAQEGVICRVHVRGLERFQIPVLLEELGIDPKSARAWRLRGARRLLIPGGIFSRMRSAARRAREAVDRWSLQAVSAFVGGGWRYVPAAAWERLIREFEAARSELAGLRQEIVDNLPSIRADALTRMEEIAREAWGSEWVRSRFPSREAFAQLLRDRAESRLQRSILEAEPDAELVVYALLLPADLAEEQAREAAAREALRQARELARAQAEKMLGPFEEALRELRARLAAELAAAADSMRRTGVLNPKVRARVIRAIHEIRVLCSFAEDPDLEALLERLEKAARRAPACARGQPPEARREELQSFRDLIENSLNDLRYALNQSEVVRKILW